MTHQSITRRPAAHIPLTDPHSLGQSPQYVSTPGSGRMPPGSDVVYSVISGGVTLAKQVSDLVFAQQTHRLAQTSSNWEFPPGGAEEEEDMETGADGRPLWRQDHGPSTPLDLL